MYSMVATGMGDPYYSDDSVTLWHGDALAVLRELPDRSVNCCVTSPPYFGLRDYGVAPTEWPEVSYSPMVGIPSITVPAMSCELGHEPDPIAFIGHLRLLFAEVRRVLADDGTLWLNLGDSYSAEPPGATPYADRKTTLSAKKHSAATKAMRESVRIAAVDRTKFLPRKNLMGIPWRTALALQSDGWILRNDIIWAKPNAMPESVTDRLSTKHEHLFMFSKSRSYWFDLDPIREPHLTADRPIPIRDYAQTPGTWAAGSGGNHRTSGPEGVGRNDQGRNPGDVWEVATQPFSSAHFAVMPRRLAERAILAGCKLGGTVIDPFSGSGTTGLAAAKHGRKYVGIDLSADYLDLSLRTRLGQTALLDGTV